MAFYMAALAEGGRKLLYSDDGKSAEEGKSHENGKAQVKLYRAFKEFLIEGGSLPEEVTFPTAKSMVEAGKFKFVWLGAESAESVSYILGVGKEKIIKLDPDKAVELREDEVKALEKNVLVCYNGNLAGFVGSVLRKEYGIDSFSLKGGIISVVKQHMEIRHTKKPGRQT